MCTDKTFCKMKIISAVCIKMKKYRRLPNSFITSRAVRFHEIELVLFRFHGINEIGDDFFLVHWNRLEHALNHFRQLRLVHAGASLKIEEFLETAQRISR